MGGQPLVLQGKDLPLYHAAAVIASNYVVVLADLARALLVDAGVPAERAVPALVPLIKSVVVNLADQGLPGALTGPAVRGDVATIEKHLGALEARAPEVLDVYKRLGREALRLAREKNAELSDVAVERLGALFGGLPDVNHKNGVDNVAAEPVGAKKRR
jgi:predicted short-subunit dehydrogenase-like oxidoreductase (DUF2520 family)